MQKLTITEALADLKTTTARIAKLREFVMQYVARPSTLRDPHEKKGGSAELVRRRLQAIKDLEERRVDLRAAINDANAHTVVSIDGVDRSIERWLIWRREVAGDRKALYEQTRNQIRQMRERFGGKTSVETNEQIDIVVALDEDELLSNMEHIERVLGELDGKLSLVNATTTVEISDVAEVE